MKPYVICHMASSIDGRIVPSRWRPRIQIGDLFDRLHEKLEGQAWLVGRVTGEEFAKAERYPAYSGAPLPREPWVATSDARAYGVVLDAEGKIAWGRSDIGGDPIVVVLTEQVSDAHLAGLRSDGVSYIFAGAASVDLNLALETLHRLLGIERLLLEGGGIANGNFLRAGLVDEISLIVWPVIDGSAGAPSIIDSTADDGEELAPLNGMKLLSCETMAEDAIWLRYRLENG
ncbi:MAG: RibD family protein [Pseudomonadota bacterium]|nr:RibD family protein [Pseudomonadota bacterium]